MSKKILTLPGIISSSQITGSSVFKIDLTTSKWSDLMTAVEQKQPLIYIDGEHVCSVLSYIYQDNTLTIAYFSEEESSVVTGDFKQGVNDTIVNANFYIDLNATLWIDLVNAVNYELNIYYVVSVDEEYIVNNYEIYDDVFYGNYYNESGEYVEIELEESGNGGIEEHIDWETRYFTIISLEDNNRIYLYGTSGYEHQKTFYYSVDNGETWNSRRITLPRSGFAEVTLDTIQTGEEMLIKHTGDPVGTSTTLCIKSTGTIDLCGNIMSLYYGDNFYGQWAINDYSVFYYIFGNSQCVHTHNLVLPATSLYYGCYESMFSGCGLLVTAPKKLPATYLTERCYASMFKDCISLLKAPVLYGRTCYSERDNHYSSMFMGCSSLSYIKIYAVSIYMFGPYSSGSWVSGVAKNGTFVIPAGFYHIDVGVNGIPEGWNIEYF